MNKVRASAQALAGSIAFEGIFLLTIIVNSLLLMLYDPVKGTFSLALFSTQLLFLVLFSFEFIVRVLGQGLPGYLESKWNVLDVIILVLGWIQFALREQTESSFGSSTPVVSIFRLVRLLRPLQRMNPELFWVTQSVVRAMPMICSAAVVFVALQVIFAISGLIYFRGALQQRCSGENPEQFCGTLGYHCPAPQTCLVTGSNPDYNVTSFDDIFHVVPILFQAMTMEGWSSIMYALADTSGPMVQLYFILQVIFGGYFMLQVLVALLAVNISLERQDNTRRVIEAKPIQNKLYEQFCEEHKLSLLSQMQMRLVLSFEFNPTSEITSRRRHDEYLSRHAAIYPEWKRAILPLLRPVGDNGAVDEKAVGGGKDAYCAMRGCGWGKRLAELRARKLAGEREDANWLSKFCCRIAASKWFRLYFMGAVLALNLLALAVIHYNQPVWMFTLQVYCDYVFFAIFGLEMLIKLVGFGPIQYWTNPRCAFEGLLTLIGFVQFANAVHVNFAAPLRLLRMLRFFPYLFQLGGVRVMARAVLLATKTALPFVFIMVLFILIFATLGLHLFGARMLVNGPEDCSPFYPNFPPHCPPRLNFDTMQNALLTTFILVIGENWNLVMLDVVAATSLWSFLYFLAILVLGSWILLNIFLGVLIDSFLLVSEQERARSKSVQDAAATAAAARGSSPERPASRAVLQAVEEEGDLETPVMMMRAASSSSSPLQRAARSSARLNFLLKRNKSKRQEARRIDLDREEAKATAALQEHVEEQRMLKRKREQYSNFRAHPSYPHPGAIWCYRNNKLRLLIGSLVVSKPFRWATICTILASSISICFTNAPVQLTYAFFALFTLEFLLKVLAFGFLSSRGAYLLNKWNMMDFVLLLLNLATVVLYAQEQQQQEGGSAVVQVLHATRSLSVLRIVRYVRGIRVTLNSLAGSFRPVVELSLVILSLFIGWAVIASFVFHGMFYACTELDSKRRIPEDNLCMSNELYSFVCDANDTCPGVWENPSYGARGTYYSFDNVGESLLVLFEMSTDEDWFVPMLAAMDSPMIIGHNARREASYSTSLFFCLAVIFFNMFVMQVFVAVLVDEFHQSGRVADSRAFLTPRQAEWIRIKTKANDFAPRRSSSKAPKRPGRSTGQWLYRVASSPAFRTAFHAVILVNTCVLLSIHYEPTSAYLSFFQIVDWAIGALYWIVLCLQLYTFGARDYFQRLPDCLITPLVCVTTAVGWAIPAFFPTAQLIDSFMVVHLVFAVPQTRRLLATLGLSAPQVVNVAMLLLLVLYIYAIVGVAVFGPIIAEDTVNGRRAVEFEHLNRYANFNTFENAMVTLFRMSCGEGWHGIMRELALAGNAFALPFCLSFILLVQFLLMNLIVAVVMFDLEEEVENRDDMSKVKLSHLIDFAACWNECRLEHERASLVSLMDALAYPRRAGGGDDLEHELMLHGTEQEDDYLYLPVDLVFDLLDRLPDPLRLNKTHSYKMEVLREMRIPVNAREEIHFHTTLNAVVDRVILGDAIYFRDSKVRFPSEAHFRELRNLVDLRLSEQALAHEASVRAKMQREDGLDAAKLLAVKRVQRAMKAFLVSGGGGRRREDSMVTATSAPVPDIAAAGGVGAGAGAASWTETASGFWQSLNLY